MSSGSTADVDVDDEAGTVHVDDGGGGEGDAPICRRIIIIIILFQESNNTKCNLVTRSRIRWSCWWCNYFIDI